MGLATVGGLGIVLLAITLDRVTQAMGQPRRGARHWWQSSPGGLVVGLARFRAAPAQRVPHAPADMGDGARCQLPCDGLTRAHPSAPGAGHLRIPALISSLDRCEPAVVAGAQVYAFKPL